MVPLQVHEKLLSTEEVEECISIEFNPNRAGFYGSEEVWTRDVLNLGVRPDKIIAKVLCMLSLGVVQLVTAMTGLLRLPHVTVLPCVSVATGSACRGQPVPRT